MKLKLWDRENIILFIFLISYNEGEFEKLVHNYIYYIEAILLSFSHYYISHNSILIDYDLDRLEYTSDGEKLTGRLVYGFWFRLLVGFWLLAFGLLVGQIAKKCLVNSF